MPEFVVSRDKFEVAAVDGEPGKLIFEVSKLVSDIVPDLIDIVVAEDSICGTVTDTVFVTDDPLEESKDMEPLVSVVLSDLVEADEKGDRAKVL